VAGADPALPQAARNRPVHRHSPQHGCEQPERPVVRRVYARAQGKD